MQLHQAAVGQPQQDGGQAAGRSVAKAQLTSLRPQAALSGPARHHPGHAARHAHIALGYLAHARGVAEGLLLPPGHQGGHGLVHQLLRPKPVHLRPGRVLCGQPGEAVHRLVVEVAGIHGLHRPLYPPLRAQAVLDKVPERAVGKLFQPGDRGAADVKQLLRRHPPDALFGRLPRHRPDQRLRARAPQLVLPHPGPGLAPGVLPLPFLQLQGQGFQGGHRRQGHLPRVARAPGQGAALLRQQGKEAADRLELRQRPQGAALLIRQGIAQVEAFPGRGERLQKVQGLHLLVSRGIQPEITPEGLFRFPRLLPGQQAVIGRGQDAVIEPQYEHHARPVRQEVAKLPRLQVPARGRQGGQLALRQPVFKPEGKVLQGDALALHQGAHLLKHLVQLFKNLAQLHQLLFKPRRFQLRLKRHGSVLHAALLHEGAHGGQGFGGAARLHQRAAQSLHGLCQLQAQQLRSCPLLLLPSGEGGLPLAHADAPAQGIVLQLPALLPAQGGKAALDHIRHVLGPVALRRAAQRGQQIARRPMGGQRQLIGHIAGDAVALAGGFDQAPVHGQAAAQQHHVIGRDAPAQLPHDQLRCLLHLAVGGRPGKQADMFRRILKGRLAQAQQVLFQVGQVIRQARLRRIKPFKAVGKPPLLQPLHQAEHAAAHA